MASPARAVYLGCLVISGIILRGELTNTADEFGVHRGGTVKHVSRAVDHKECARMLERLPRQSRRSAGIRSCIITVNILVVVFTVTGEINING